ncbi:ABC transporter ATP-binding protein [Corynebacterium epidermidicanis]|uniref:ABC-type antimicrobial peptide transport system, ATPase component n=1 Tax=Corynebacterium epidermidicanis TaxID=1050174 RepID=A0A0G3GQB6_9CORY|nr:ABC transporter ATP-binding protein [Corynebacterium epidermidicanis]AKK03401.1 ABC-type antimicrobial peptide transport system, ATPase component [Corynebacterium epidermidicanis]
MSQQGLSVNNLSITIQDGTEQRNLLDNVSLHVAPGSVLGVSGPSGSGKSTLLSAIGCLQPPTSGTITLQTASGELDLASAKGPEAARIRRNHIGIVFQQPNLLPSLSVREQLLLMPRLGRVLPLPRQQKIAAEQRAASLLEAVELSGMDNRRISELSGGQQARVNIARALMNSPELLLVDEPTAALDQATAATVTRLIVDMAQEFGAATLYVSHDANQLAELPDTIELVDGVLVTS